MTEVMAATMVFGVSAMMFGWVNVLIVFLLAGGWVMGLLERIAANRKAEEIRTAAHDLNSKVADLELMSARVLVEQQSESNKIAAMEHKISQARWELDRSYRRAPEGNSRITRRPSERCNSLHINN